MKLKLSVAASLGLLVLSSWAALALTSRGAQDDPDPSFTYDADPVQPLITVASERGSQSVLYASGRFVQQWGGVHAIETQCSFEEVQHLLLLMAKHGLLDLDSRVLDQKLIQRGGSPLSNSHIDTPKLTIEVSLDSYTVRGIERSPFYKKLDVWHSGLEQQIYPDVPELVGLDLFMKELSGLVKRAKANR